MLSKIKIKNYALINELEVSFANGFSVITGETGAGKSIILGALGLTLGERVDTTVLKNSDNKCIIETWFDLVNLNLKPFFIENDLDFCEFMTDSKFILILDLKTVMHHPIQRLAYAVAFLSTMQGLHY